MFEDGKISCIIPMYNSALYIERCIQSVLEQSYTNLEVIVVDDGSNDHSSEIVENKFSSQKIRMIKKCNEGVSTARNVGMLEATGEYLFFLDSDDCLPRDAFAVLMEAVKHYSADIAIGRDLCFCEGEEMPHDIYCGDAFLWNGDETLVKTLEDFPNTWNVCGKLFRKSFIQSLLFVDGKTIGEDSYFFFQCALRLPKTVYLEKNVYYVSLRAGSATRSCVSSQKIEDIIYFVNCKKKSVGEQFSKYNNLMNNLELKAHLSILHMLIKTDEYSRYEKQSLRVVRKNRSYFISGQSNDQLYYAIVRHYYWLYKKVVRLIKH